MLNKIKAKLFKRWFSKATEKIDTIEERKVMTDEVVKKGMPEWAASGLALLIGIILESMHTLDITVLFSDPVSFGKMLLSAVLARVLLQLQTPNTDKKDAGK